MLAARGARAVLFGVQPSDPTSIGVVVTVLIATGCAACLAPAFRATMADQLHSLSQPDERMTIKALAVASVILPMAVLTAIATDRVAEIADATN